MANNVFGGRPNAVVSKADISFGSAGINSSNTLIIYLVDDPLKSYVPGRPINGITGFETNKGYYMVPITDMDLEDILVPPVEGGLPPTGDADATAFLSAAGITDATQRSAIDSFVVALKAASIWTKMKAIYPFVGGTAAAHKFNLKNPLDTDAAFRLSYTGVSTHNAAGYTPGAGFADTHIIPATHLTANNTHLAGYGKDASTAPDYFLSTGTATDEFSLAYSTALYVRMYNATTGEVQAVGAPSQKLSVGSRTSTSVLKAFVDGTQVGTTQTGAPGTMPATSLYINAAPPFNRSIQFLSVGDGLSDAEVTSLTNAVNTMETTLSRA